MKLFDLDDYFKNKEETLSEQQVTNIQTVFDFLKDKIFWNINVEERSTFDLKSTLKEQGQDGLRTRLDRLINKGIYSSLERGYFEGIVEEWVDSQGEGSLPEKMMKMKQVIENTIYDHTGVPIHDPNQLKQWLGKSENTLTKGSQNEAAFELKNILTFLAIACTATSVEDKQMIFKGIKADIEEHAEGNEQIMERTELHLKAQHIDYPFTILAVVGGLFNVALMDTVSVTDKQKLWHLMSGFLNELVKHETHDEVKAFYTYTITLVDTAFNLYPLTVMGGNSEVSFN